MVVSPHAQRSGVYRSVVGDLGGFGLPSVSVAAEVHEGATASLIRTWGHDLDGASDHGIVVPLVVDAVRVQDVVAVGLAEVTGPSAPAGPGEAIEDAQALARAIEALAVESSVAVVASAHLGAALDERAPSWPLEGAVDVEQAVLGTLERDVGDFPSLAGDLAAAGSCGSGPLVVLGELFGGSALRRCCYVAPFGVGYLAGIVE